MSRDRKTRIRITITKNRDYSRYVINLFDVRGVSLKGWIAKDFEEFLTILFEIREEYEVVK
jgi:hypothetical protein